MRQDLQRNAAWIAKASNVDPVIVRRVLAAVDEVQRVKVARRAKRLRPIFLALDRLFAIVNEFEKTLPLDDRFGPGMRARTSRIERP